MINKSCDTCFYSSYSGAGDPCVSCFGLNKWIAKTIYNEQTVTVFDTVNKPQHYSVGIEPIQAIESWKLGYNLGNVVKYVARADHKGKRLEDLKKARWYLDREINNNESDV